MIRIAVLSDIHGNIAALDKVVTDLKQRQVDTVVNLGDHLSGPLWPKETVEFLMDQEWVHLSGNMDEALVNQAPELHSLSDAYAYKFLNDQEKEWLRALATCVELKPGVLAFHGTPANKSEYLLETVQNGGARRATLTEIEHRLGNTKARVMLCGHSHKQRIVELSRHCLIVNPGSVGLPAYQDELPQPHVMESGSAHARYAVVDLTEKECAVQLLAIPYDSQKAARQARKQNRPEWAIALETGFMTRI
jgi:putative phosphoesterase